MVVAPVRSNRSEEEALRILSTDGVLRLTYGLHYPE